MIVPSTAPVTPDAEVTQGRRSPLFSVLPNSSDTEVLEADNLPIATCEKASVDSNKPNVISIFLLTFIFILFLCS